MKNLRNSKLTRLLCLLLATTMIMWSCQPESITTQNGCTVIAHDIPTLTNIPNTTETVFELVSSIQDQVGHQSMDSLYYEFFSASQSSTTAINKLNSEIDDYNSNEYGSYIQNHDFLSNGLKSFFINFESNLDSVLLTEPDLAQFTSFINTEISNTQGSSSNLCQKDAELAEYYLLNALGYAQYYYNNYNNPGSFSSHVLEGRGCGLFAKLGCGILSLTAGVIGGVLSLVGVISADITVNGQPLNPEDQENLSIIVAAVTAWFIAKKTYNWCCPDDDKDQNCYRPDMHIIKRLGCNEYRIRLLGKSDYSTTRWDNINTIPAQATTNIPSLVFTVPSPTQASTFHAPTVLCLENGTTVFTFDYDEFTDGPFETTEVFPLQWTVAPPSNFTLESGLGGMHIRNSNIFFTRVNSPNLQNYQYSWEVTAPNIIKGNSNSATVELKSPGLVTTKVTVTDLCSNYSETLQSNTYVQ